MLARTGTAYRSVYLYCTRRDDIQQRNTVMGLAQSGERARHGWRVLKVLPNSPCSHLDIMLFFDFVVAADGQDLVLSSDGTLISLKISLISFSCRTWKKAHSMTSSNLS